jgi:hypothetical protein
MLSDRARGILALFAHFVGLCALALVATAAWQRYQRARVVRTWPQVSATVTHCGLHQAFPFQRDGGGVSSWVVCDISYMVDGQSHEARMASTHRHAGRSGIVYSLDGLSVSRENPERILRAWMTRHPAGSALSIRYNPKSPTEASLVGTDRVLDIDPVSGLLTGSIVFACIAAICGGLAWITRTGIRVTSAEAAR